MDKVLRDAARERKPQPGDMALCFKCAAILAFTDDFGLRCANAEELDNLNFGVTIYRGNQHNSQWLVRHSPSYGPTVPVSNTFCRNNRASSIADPLIDVLPNPTAQG